MADQAEYVGGVGEYASSVDEAAVEGVTKHLGIALRSRDSSLVSCTDQVERDRVRDSFLKGKLGLTSADGDLDAAVLEICDRMSGDTNKSRVTFY